MNKTNLEWRLNRKDYRLLPKQKYCNMKTEAWRVSSTTSNRYILIRTLKEIDIWLRFQERHGRFPYVHMFA